MSRVGVVTFSDGRDFVDQGTTSPKRASGTWRTRGGMPPASPAARTPPPRTSPRCTGTPRSGASRPGERPSITSPPLGMSPSPTSRAVTVPTTQVTKGRFEVYDDEKNRALMHQGAYVWPHSVARKDASAEALPSRFGANRIHAVPGDITAEFGAVCRFLEIDLERLDV